jgi:hypothetical protein
LGGFGAVPQGIKAAHGLDTSEFEFGEEHEV